MKIILYDIDKFQKITTKARAQSWRAPAEPPMYIPPTQLQLPWLLGVAKIPSEMTQIVMP